MDTDQRRSTPPQQQGASAFWPPAEAPDEGSGEELPMTVWLRGDEPLCEEFTLDADAVMDQLGIKRSRLTQISGKQLRVGRMRLGRYLRPVYRQADVDEYLKWTRATATHLKSSSVLKDAALRLEERSEALTNRLEVLGASLPDRLRQTERKLSRGLVRSVARLFQRQTRLVRRLETRLESARKGLTAKADETHTRLANLEDKLSRLDTLMTRLAEEATSTRVQGQEERSRLESLLESVTTTTAESAKTHERLSQRIETLEATTHARRIPRRPIPSPAARRRLKTRPNTATKGPKQTDTGISRLRRRAKSGR